MGLNVYAYEISPGTSTTTGFGNSIDEVTDELRKVRAEIALEDGYEDPTSEVYAFDIDRPDLDQILSVLNGDADLGEIIIRNKRVVATISADSA